MTPSLRHCSNKYELAREGEKDKLFFIFRMKSSRAVRYDDIYRMDEIKSLLFHIMFCRLYRGVAKYIVSGNTFSSFE